MKIEIKSIYGDIIFSFEKQRNTTKDTVEEAVSQGVSLRWADLYEADLRGADLRRADLRGADLARANLTGADLRGADLRDANLSGADLRGADLRGADLRGTNLSGADLRDADLRDANLSGANLREARGVELAIARTRILPEGDIVVYKKCRDKVIVKLKIPAEAKRSSAFGRKCRAEFTEVLEIISDSGVTEAKSIWDSSVTYEVGKIVRPIQPYYEDWMVECAPGIHFYITRLEAENHS